MNVRPVPAVGEAEPDAPASSSGGGSGSGVEGRVATLEARIQYLATKEDIQKIKVWVLGGVVGAMVLGVGIAFTVARFWPA